MRNDDRSPAFVRVSRDQNENMESNSIGATKCWKATKTRPNVLFSILHALDYLPNTWSHLTSDALGVQPTRSFFVGNFFLFHFITTIKLTKFKPRHHHLKSQRPSPCYPPENQISQLFLVGGCEGKGFNHLIQLFMRKSFFLSLSRSQRGSESIYKLNSFRRF